MIQYSSSFLADFLVQMLSLAYPALFKTRFVNLQNIWYFAFELMKILEYFLQIVVKW